MSEVQPKKYRVVVRFHPVDIVDWFPHVPDEDGIAEILVDMLLKGKIQIDYAVFAADSEANQWLKVIKKET